MTSADGLTMLLQRAGQGDTDAQEQAASRVYEELRRTAHRLMATEKNITLQPTALVNEAFLRLLESDAMSKAPNRAYFFASAAQAMRRILVDEFRRRKAQKKGGGMQRQPITIVLAEYVEKNIDLLELDEALNDLQAMNQRQAQVVHLRWFTQLTVKEVAELLGLSTSTVEADWRAARAFLYSQLHRD